MDISKVGLRILKQNRETYVRQLPSAHAQSRIDAIDAELASRYTRVSSVGGTAGYVLTATGQFEHKTSSRDGITKCGVSVDTERQYGTREWWHCLTCGS